MKTMEMTNKFWNVKTEGNISNIDLFGYVGGSKEGGFFVPEGFNEKEFLDELRAIPADNALEISINSFGGSVYTALSIYTLLKNHKGAITFRVDGAAMSAATIITSVPGAKVIMPQGAMMMIHKVSSIAAGNSDDFRKAADDMEKLENNIIDIYVAKTGKTADEIQPLVDAETYFTAAEAVEFGLADELDESKTVENKMDGDIVMVNGLKVDAKFFKHAPKGFINRAETPKVSAIHTQANKEEKTMTLEQLKAEHPDIVDAIRNEALQEGAAAERTRIQEIEALGCTGHEDLIHAAKFENFQSAPEVAVAVLKAENERKKSIQQSRVDDAAELNGITAAAGNEGLVPNAEKKAQEEAEMKAIIEAGAKGFARK